MRQTVRGNRPSLHCGHFRNCPLEPSYKSILSFFSPSHPHRNGINGRLILVNFRPQSTENGPAGNRRATARPKKSRAKARLKVLTGRRQTEWTGATRRNPDDWITLIKIQLNPLPNG